jgi:alkanesulfonate monooxygenase SsuD/methylene tetrahydromethanopterin reductase-like flavin-dependent oxidoreductase (luciferase family)
MNNNDNNLAKTKDISTRSRNSKRRSTESDTFKNSLDIAKHVEKWGYNRFWLAEHHNMPGIASSATSILIGYIASGTTTLRIGSEELCYLIMHR